MNNTKLNKKYKFSSLQRDLLGSINSYRSSYGLTPLTLDKSLCRSADSHSQSMIDKDFYGHENTSARVKKFGYKGKYVGENIAVGYATVPAVFNAWINSIEHRANILNPNFKQTGISLKYAAQDLGVVNYRYYWTQEFGAFK